MTNGSLIAPVTSTRRAWTGAGLADGVQGLVEAIQGGSWKQGVLAGAGLGLEIAGSVMDPFSALLSNGIGWAMEYFEPLREMLDWLTGKPDTVMSHAATWNNIAGALFEMAGALKDSLARDLPTWGGEAAEAYQALMANNVDAVGGLGATAAAMAVATEGAGGLVSLVREIVRDLIAELVSHVIVWVAEAIFVVTIPVIATQIAAAVVKWSGMALSYITALVESIQNLSKLVDG
ncbi:hypothetical protein Afil01_68570 [Actinorhabdospora filicis]|uniref:PPE family protein n=1 Tax=Actinorhabdospora filicis TaxID=1785913 RepID=A0A9W6SU93_9ACTN|nr:hypothetical protein [Actinorhabdospora filicis]GLZ82050.1 hypothetical protein Afil01_68570 [Actinorhabdospora filicis]